MKPRARDKLSINASAFVRYPIELPINRACRNAQELSRNGLVPFGASQRLANDSKLNLVERSADLESQLRGGVRRCIRDVIGQVAFRQGVASRQHDRSLDNVLELANVARPRVVHELFEGGARGMQTRSSVLGAGQPEEVVHEKRHVLPARAQRRGGDGTKVEAGIKGPPQTSRRPPRPPPPFSPSPHPPPPLRDFS